MRLSQFGVGVVGLVVTASVPLGAQTTTGDQSPDGRGQAYQQFMVGRHLEGEGDTDGAIAAFREAATLDPVSGEPLAELAALYARAGRADEAIATAEESLEREPDNQTGHRILGVVYASAAGSREGTPEDVDLAVTHLEQARGTLLPDFQVELTLARLYLRTDAADKAITLLEQLLDDELGFAEAGLLLSQAYEQAGRADEALSTLEAAVANGRPSYRALARLGEMYERRQRWSDAAATYEAAVAVNGRSADIRRRLAGSLLESGNPIRAREVLQELIGMRPRDAAGLHLLAEVELELNNFDAAESVARQLVEMEPDGLRGPFVLAQVFGRRREHQQVIDTLVPVLRAARERNTRPERLAGLFARLGSAYEQVDDLPNATLVYEDAVELMPTSLAFNARLTQAYIDADRTAEAMSVLTRVKHDHPGDLTLARLEAQLLGNRGDVGLGEALLRDALAANDGEPTAYVALAGFYSEHDRFDDAITVLESAQQRFSEDTSILFQLGAVLEQNGQFVGAERAFRRLLDRDPEHAPTLNYLGYMLADRGMRLEESVELLERAIAKDPHNGSYLDSLGWAYYKLERLDLAEPPLRAASDQLRHNSVVQDHLADLLNRLGRYSEAIETWERALGGDGEGVEPDVIERKIDGARRRIGR